YLQKHEGDLDEDSRRRLTSNPLRVLDSKNPDVQALLDDAPVMLDYLDEPSREDFVQLRELLEAAGVEYVLNPRLVRGLDYYNKTVYEWVTDQLGAQGTICGGGRYDGLVEQLGGKSTPAVGFAMGMERLVLLLQAQEQRSTPAADVYVVAVGKGTHTAALSTVEALRDELEVSTTIVQHVGGGSFKSQMKRADKSGAQVALIWGEDEVRAQSVTVKPLRSGASDVSADQQTIPIQELLPTLRALLAG
ncbi:MAG: ATP phosphoribosyltransferase regulatory subunit, partial [Pseudomonadota bacterium]